MYKAYNLSEIEFKSQENELYDRGIEVLCPNNDKTINSLSKLDTKIFDGGKIQNDWFPQINFDVFISHSHKDIRTAIALVGWLYEMFGLTAFVDYCVWGRYKGLLDLLNKRNSDDAANQEHAHIMLSTALTQMMDRTECLIFYNTPNSIRMSDLSQTSTFSPWIYYEILTSKFLAKNKPERMKSKQYLTESISYGLDMTHLIDITATNLIEWKNSISGGKGSQSLNWLYDNCKAKEKVEG
jgi:hypothetical protein